MNKEETNNAASAAAVSEGKVEAWRYDFTTYAHKDASGADVAECVYTEIACDYYRHGIETNHYCDIGNSGGILNVYTDDGIYVTDECEICDRMSGLKSVKHELLGRIHKVGEYAECEVSGPADFNKVRITAISVPHFSLEKSAEESDLTIAQKMVIKFYGEPMAPNGSLVPTCRKGFNTSVNRNVIGLVNKIFSDYLSAKVESATGVGTRIDAKWCWDDFSVDYASISFVLTACCEEDIRIALEKGLGAKNLDLFSVRVREGDEGGEKRVTANIHITEEN